MEKSEVNAIRTQVTHCHINNLDMCKKFRIFVGWEGGVACFALDICKSDKVSRVWELWHASTEHVI